MRFLLDQNVSERLAEWLQEHGHDAWHAKHVRLSTVDDKDVAAEARKRRAVLITKDRDFLQIAGQTPHDPLQVVVLRFGNTTNPELTARFEAALPAVLEALEAGEPIIEIE